MKVGKFILENLTTGMYSDSKVIYREYIQNACDQIDLAQQLGILPENGGCIEITIDRDKRNICIYDDATGINEDDFTGFVGDIANSRKRKGENKGFRGIGRLCGLAYCRTLRFVTSYCGEKVKSVMTCDAQKMREILASDSKPSLNQVWDEIVSYSTESEKEDEHYFEVQLVDVNRENTDLLDVEAVRDYLSFVSPVPYKNTFFLRTKITDYARQLGYRLDEYEVSVNGTTIFKEYSTVVKDKNGKTCDEIEELHFHHFRDDDGKLIAWMWVGMSQFEKQIPSNNPMRGLRLRTGNIQIGDANVLVDLFKEHRGNFYFTGEVFSVDKELIPNSQRDYFNENEARVKFEKLLRAYFYETLHKIYTEANRVKNDCKAVLNFKAKKEEFEKKEKESNFLDAKEKAQLQLELEEEQEKAQKAMRSIEKMSTTTHSSIIDKIKNNIVKKSGVLEIPNGKVVVNDPVKSSGARNKYITTSFSFGERQLLSKILEIIKDVAPKNIADEIQQKIKEELSENQK